jgi:Spy/CpxP family protein refolding chaperone
MKTKHIFLVLSGLIAGALLTVTALRADETAAAGDAGNAPAASAPGHSHRLTPEQMAKELGLSDEVAAKFKTVLGEARTQMEALRNQEGLSPADKQAKFKDIQEGTLTKLANILTPEQLQKFKKLVHTPLKRIRRAVTAPGGATN